MSSSTNRFPHQRLDAYRVSLRLVKGVEDLVRAFPRGHADTRDQLRRAASATLRHIAEASGRTFPRDKAARFMVARGEVAECDAVLEMAHMLDLADGAEIVRLRRLADRVSAMLLGLVRAERRYADPG